MSDFAVASPGRVCLVGDHCDWAGGFSLAASIPLRVTATVRPRLDRLLVVESRVSGGTIRGSYSFDEPGFSADDPLRYAAAAVAALRDRGIVLKGTELRVSSDLPARRGLGSSAAFTLVTVKALARGAGVNLSPLELAEIAYEAEHDLLGIACGRMDQAAAVHTRPVFLDFTGAAMRVEEIDLPIHIHLVLGDAGGAKDTVTILETLHQKRFSEAGSAGAAGAPRARGVAFAFDELFPELVRRGRDALLAGDRRALGESMTVSQAVYDEYLLPACDELSAPGMHRLLDICRHERALGQKWTGSGGEGSFVALADTEAHQQKMVDALRAGGGSAIAVTLG